MLANATNLRRAGLLLRAMAASATWETGVFVDARKIAKDSALVTTERELAEVERFLVYQGWVSAEVVVQHGPGFYALTKHGIDESQRKPPAEPKPPKPRDQAY
jgi:hypothetical protein